MSENLLVPAAMLTSIIYQAGYGRRENTCVTWLWQEAPDAVNEIHL